MFVPYGNDIKLATSVHSDHQRSAANFRLVKLVKAQSQRTDLAVQKPVSATSGSWRLWLRRPVVQVG